MLGHWTLEKEVEWARGNNFRNLLGIEVEQVEEGFARLSLRVGENLVQAQNVAHGGVIATLLDGVIGTAVRTVVPEGVRTSTVEMNLNYTRPAGAGRISAEGRIVHAGRTLVIGTADIRNEAGKLIATGRATYIVLDKGPD